METKTVPVLVAITIVGVLILGLMYIQPTSTNKMKYFSSYGELSNFVKARSEGAYYGATNMAMRTEMAAPTAAGVSGAEKAADYSTTNIQVAGVDEPDIVKTDGKYIYTVSGNNVFIVDAYPAENAKISSEIQVNKSISDIFVNKDRLVVFSSGGWYGPMVGKGVAVEIAMPTWSSGSTIYVYDISDHSNPVLVRNISVEGSYYDARMIGDYVYTIVNQPVQILDSGPVLPVINFGADAKTIAAENIAYSDVYDTSFVYTHVVAINTQDDAEEANDKVYLLGYSQNLFVSPENIYVVYTKILSYTEANKRILDAVIPQLPSDLRTSVEAVWNSQNMSSYEKMQEIGNLIQEYAQSLGPEAGATFMKNIEDIAREVTIQMQKEIEKTVIHKISISGANVEYKTSGEVPGRTLNQFSMDEYNSNFRIATTTGNSWDNTSLNHVYVLDSNLQTIGKLENLAQSEQIYSARFMGDRAYLVTFKRTDPLFVIDMSNPYAPTVLGELKMPGFSDYLHPYDEGHLIGVGQQTDENGRVTGQVKLSFFDVSDVANPKELSTYLIGEKGDWTYSEALYDHKAFLFSKTKDLLVIPVSLNNWKENKYLQGAYVFSLTLDGGFMLKGTVTHVTANASQEEQYYDYSSAVRRALYMDTTLYTVSDSMVKANALADLSDIAAVKLNQE